MLRCELWLFFAQVGEGDPMKEQELEDFYKKGVPRRGQAMPMRSEPLVPKFLDEGRDTGMLGVEQASLKQCACAKGLLILCNASGPERKTLRHFQQSEAIQKAWRELRENASSRRKGKNKDDIL